MRDASLMPFVRCGGSLSPDAIVSRVRNRLQHCSYAGLREIECDLIDDVLTLRGTVPSFYLKQMAQELAHELIDRSTKIDNRVAVWGRDFEVGRGPIERRINDRQALAIE